MKKKVPILGNATEVFMSPPASPDRFNIFRSAAAYYMSR